MSTLLPCANDLAKNPPVDIYQVLMNWWAKDLGKDNPGVEKNWANQCKLEGGEKAATFSVEATCDMAAMCIVMAAAGVTRIEAMKGAIRAAVKKEIKNQVFADNATGDQVYLFKEKKNAKEFAKLFERWCGLEGNGVVQLKFKAKYDWHTFAVERVWDKDKDKIPLFLVYQAYQNVYRLTDFLGWGNNKEQADHLALVWKYMKEKDQSEFKGMDGFIEPILERTVATAKTIGSGKPLDVVSLTKYVLDPLTNMLAGGVSNKDYVLMTASGATDNTLSTDTMAVLMCDHVSPGEYKKNYLALRELPKELTMYPECD
ncbi:MAG: hypothetical protein ACJ8AT_09480 [Hyalangium sp.]|uniref:hypothetical protein n=1 Tax=Hyalangium sp. TaxID=2028555 RepID=UPI00389AE5C9